MIALSPEPRLRDIVDAIGFTISPAPGRYGVSGGRRRFGGSGNVTSWYEPGVAALMARATGSGLSRMTGQAFVERTTRAIRRPACANPLRRRQANQILLTAKVRVSRQHHVKAVALRSGQKVAVGQFAPPELIGKRDGVAGEKTKNGPRNVTVMSNRTLDTLPLRMVVDCQHVSQRSMQPEVFDHLFRRLAGIHVLNDGFRRHARVVAQRGPSGQVSGPGTHGGAATPIDRHVRHFGAEFSVASYHTHHQPSRSATDPCVTPPPDRASLSGNHPINQETP